jgi:hypothetical protein
MEESVEAVELVIEFKLGERRLVEGSGKSFVGC